jgi:hypothetical protein
MSTPSRWLGWLGWAFGVAGGVFFLQLFGYRLVRKPTAAAEGDETGIVLPLRPGHAPRQAATALLLGSLPVPLALVDGTRTMWAVSVATLSLGLVAAWWLSGPAARASRVHLDPEGVTVPRGLTSTNRIAWRDVRSVDIVPGWQPALVLQSSREDDLVGFRLLPQGWPPEQLREALAHFARHGKDRAALTTPEGVEQFVRN